jgi:hypothetical protein
LDALDLGEREMKVNNSTINVDTYLTRVDGAGFDWIPHQREGLPVVMLTPDTPVGMKAAQSIARVLAQLDDYFLKDPD